MDYDTVTYNVVVVASDPTLSIVSISSQATMHMWCLSVAIDGSVLDRLFLHVFFISKEQSAGTILIVAIKEYTRSHVMPLSVPFHISSNLSSEWKSGEEKKEKKMIELQVNKATSSM